MKTQEKLRVIPTRPKFICCPRIRKVHSILSGGLEISDKGLPTSASKISKPQIELLFDFIGTAFGAKMQSK
jgi:hypothetical protein